MNKIKLILLTTIGKQLYSVNLNMWGIVCTRHIQIPKITMFPYTICKTAFKTSIKSNFIIYEDEEYNGYIPPKEIQRELLMTHTQNLVVKPENKYARYKKHTYKISSNNKLMDLKFLNLLFLEYEDLSGEKKTITLFNEKDKNKELYKITDIPNILSHILKENKTVSFDDATNNYKLIHLDHLESSIPYKEIKVHINKEP